MRLAAIVLALGVMVAAQPAPVVTTWRLDGLSRAGSDAIEVIGSPAVVQTEIGAAIQFNGTSDGLLIARNPIEGLSRFTIEVLFAPDSDGPVEQRFLHIQETTGENRRALVELRLNNGRWALDTFLRHDAEQMTLLDPSRTHTSAAWHVATMTFDGTTQRHFVDGVEEGSGAVAFKPLGGGQASIGVRQNRVFWFKGRIHTIRISPTALAPAQFLRAPSRVIALWPEGVPGRQPDAAPERIVDGRVVNVHDPSLTYYAPTGAPTGTAVIVCAGGSYARLAMDNEVAGAVHHLTPLGVAVFALKYRLSEYGHPAPLQDVLRAIRTVRSRAAEFGVRPDRIGLFGASAGGHVAASAAAWFDAPEGRTGASLDSISARPDFVALLYPVVSMTAPLAHADSRKNLLGASPSPALVDRLSIDKHVRRDMPPFFIVHTSEDRSVPIENSEALVRSLRANGVPVESHFYEKGAHGFGFAPGLGSTSAWPARMTEWLSARGLLANQQQTSREWPKGIEGQRKADLGNGTFLNPIMAGDHPDPSILKDGDDYYMTFSSFDAYPGLVIWHSRDLVNWQPIGPALFKNVGSVWAPDLVKHNGRYYIYFPGISPNRSNYVIWADDIRGPWSAPIDLKLTRIDPGHAVGPDGKRYLFLSAGELVQLADDGLSTVGAPRHVYDGWKYPADWIVEGFAQEGPKVIHRGDYYYLVLAEGGTAGPATGHMVVAARSKSIEGPWENSPYNPILRTKSNEERWWSKGHGTLVEDRAGKWWMVYHAYENGFYTLGRQTLLEPIEWTADGWFRAGGSDPATPIAKPAGTCPAGGGEKQDCPHGFAFSDDFATPRMGVQWSFYAGDEADRDRYRYENGALVLKGKGTGPSDSSPLWFVNGDHAYEMEVEIDADRNASAGLLVFYSRKLYAGLGFSDRNLRLHLYGMDRTSAKPAGLGQHAWIRLRNDRHIVTLHYSADGKTWEKYDRAIEVSGYHHNVAYDFLSLRPALYASGDGEVRFRNFKYRALP